MLALRIHLFEGTCDLFLAGFWCLFVLGGVGEWEEGLLGEEQDNYFSFSSNEKKIGLEKEKVLLP